MGAITRYACLAVICLAGAAVQFRLASRGWFYLDDLRNLSDARRSGLGWRLLVSSIGDEHFQPGGRLLHWWATVGGEPNFTTAMTVIALSIGAIGFLTARLADELFGARLFHLVLGGLVTTSPIYVQTATWYSGSDAIPCVVFMTAATLLYSQWIVRGPTLRLGAATLCQGVAILFWEQAIVMPALLGLVWLCFLRSSSRRSVRQVALSLVPFAAVSVLFDVYVSSQPWSGPLASPTIEQIALLMRTMLYRGVLAPAMGWWVATAESARPDRAAMTPAAVLLALAVVVLAVRGRLRWSALVLFAGGFVLLAATIAFTRIGIGPQLAGRTAGYLCPLPVLAGLAVAAATSGRRRSLLTVSSGERVRRRPVSPRMRTDVFRAIAVLVTAVVGAGYLIAVARGSRVATFGRENGQSAHAISKRVNAALRPGMTNLVNTRFTWPIFYRTHDGAGEISTLSPFWARDVHAVGQGAHPIAVAADGAAHLVSFNPGAAGPLQYVRLIVSTDRAATCTVQIHGVGPIEPNDPIRLRLEPGTESFILPAWAPRVRDVRVQRCAGVSVRHKQIGTITLVGPAR